MNRKNIPSFKQKAKERDHVLVYSTESLPQNSCAICKLLFSKCNCDSIKIKSIGPIKPAVSMEKKGRAGKMVTLLTKLPAHQTYLKELCKHLKRAVGSGGTHYIKEGEGVVEIQGDWRKELIELAQNYLQK